MAAPAVAQVPATLTGETLVDPFGGAETTGDIQCKLDGDRQSTGTFTSEGVAVGPYPGTYTESGTSPS